MKSRFSRFSLVVVALAWLLCAPAITQADTFVVIVESNDFDPYDITIAPGDTVCWMWTRGIHTTTSVDGLWDSDILRAGDSFEYTFNDPGDFYYICTLHLDCCGMAGVVHVVPPCPCCPPCCPKE